MNKPTLSVIVACYNEEKNIGNTLIRVHKTVPDAEILVVDDGSWDKTAEMAKKTSIKGLRVISYKPNRGKGRATRIGIDNARGEIMAQVDADFQFPPEELPRLIAPILNKRADIVFGSRFVKGATVEKGALNFRRRVANHVVSGITSILAGKRLTDVNAGFKAWTAKSIRDIDIQCDHFAYEPEIAIMAKKRGYRIVEVPVTYRMRSEGNTNVNLIREGIVIPLYLLRVKLFRK